MTNFDEMSTYVDFLKRFCCKKQEMTNCSKKISVRQVWSNDAKRVYCLWILLNKLINLLFLVLLALTLSKKDFKENQKKFFLRRGRKVLITQSYSNKPGLAQVGAISEVQKIAKRLQYVKVLVSWGSFYEKKIEK